MKHIYAFMQGTSGTVDNYFLGLIASSAKELVCDKEQTIWCKLIKDMDASAEKVEDPILKGYSANALHSYCMNNMNPITDEFTRYGGSNYYSYPIFLKIISLL